MWLFLCCSWSLNFSNTFWHWSQVKCLCRFFMCTLKECLSAYNFPHSWHGYEIGSEWALVCALRVATCVKVRSHSLHMYWSSSLCIFWWCLVRLFECMKVFSQLSQGNGLSPVCVLRCIFKLLSSRHDLPQTWQEKGFSPACILMCFFRFPARLICFPQTSQLTKLYSKWDFS